MVTGEPKLNRSILTSTSPAAGALAWAWDGAAGAAIGTTAGALSWAAPTALPAVPGTMTILRGASPTGMVARTDRLGRSTTDTSFEPSLVSSAVLPSAEMAVQCGIFPTATVPRAVEVDGSKAANRPGPCTFTSPSPVDVKLGRWGDAPTASRPTSPALRPTGLGW